MTEQQTMRFTVTIAYPEGAPRATHSASRSPSVVTPPQALGSTQGSTAATPAATVWMAWTARSGLSWRHPTPAVSPLDQIALAGWWATNHLVSRLANYALIRNH